MVEKQNKRKLLKRLKSRYRLFIINETNFQEKTSVSLTPFNVLLILSVGLVAFFIFSWGVFSLFPNVGKYSPGFSQGIDGKTKNEVLKKISMLESNMEINKKRELALKQIINGEEITAFDIPYTVDKSRSVELNINDTKADGSRVQNANEKIEKAKKEDVVANSKPSQAAMIDFETSSNDQSANYLFFTPVKGNIIHSFDARLAPFVEIRPNIDESVKAVADGTVIFKGWTPDFGNVISIQHSNNWISVYKFNLTVFKDIGSIIKSGETIGVIGYRENPNDSKKLRFELWKNGISVDPQNFINF